MYFWRLFPIVTGCLATYEHADGSGAAGDYCYGTGSLHALAIQTKNVTLCKRHRNDAFDRVPAIDDKNDGNQRLSVW